MTRTRDGKLVPEIGLWLKGKREADRLAAEGIDVPSNRLVELGRSLVEHGTPDPDTDEHLALLVAQLQARNQATRHKLETAPDIYPGNAEDREPGEQRALWGRPGR